MPLQAPSFSKTTAVTDHHGPPEFPTWPFACRRRARSASLEEVAAPVAVEEEGLGADLAATDGLDVDLGEEIRRQGRSST